MCSHNRCLFKCATVKWFQDPPQCFMISACVGVCARAGVFALAVKEGAWEDWCLIGACCRDLLPPFSVRITSSHPAQSYCLAVSQSLWHDSLSSPYFFFGFSWLTVLLTLPFRCLTVLSLFKYLLHPCSHFTRYPRSLSFYFFHLAFFVLSFSHSAPFPPSLYPFVSLCAPA